MNWKEFWNKRANAADAWTQVGRISKEPDKQDEAMQKIAEHIAELLQLQKTNKVLDVCCGNGLLTSFVSGYCTSVTGVDFSEDLIAQAKYHYPHLYFYNADVLNQHQLQNGAQHYDAIYLYYSFQYLESFDEGLQAIANLLPMLKPGGKLLIGDIPDRARFFVYYHSWSRLWQLFKQFLMNKNDMGKFWSEEEMHLICQKLNVKGSFLKQPPHLPHVHYRFDFLIEK
ncbi:MAG: class I SAM-dependent DNA methyltransferase [Bacteroidota bacterium]|nr:class I SAM-dependent methyltransferase [Sphingobacteriales bacterium]